MTDQSNENYFDKVLEGHHGDETIQPIPLDERQHWIGPATIFGGLEFCIPILMIGSVLTGSFTLAQMLPILIIAFFGIQWAGNALSGYIGAKTGLTSSIVARSGFGEKQSRFIIAMVIFVACMGWWAVQTAVTGNAISAMLGIDYHAEWGKWAIITIISGLLFAIPSIIGYSSMKWTDYIAVPAGLLLCAFGIYLSIKNFGWDKITNFQPQGNDLTILQAITLIIGMNVSQWVIAADYTRYAKPKVIDNLLIPSGIVMIGFPLMYVGAVMSIGQGTADIVEVMVSLGFPFWGFLILWLSTWTSQLVNNYSMGLSFANLMKVTSERGISILTFIGTIFALILALSGILDNFMDFLYLTSLFYPGIAGVIFTDFFIRKGKWKNNKGWNIIATISLLSAIATGYITSYIYVAGIPQVQALFVSIIVYYVLIKIKGKVAPDEFTS